MPSLWIVTWDGPSTRLLVETYRGMDWICLGLLSRWQEVCRVYCAIILTISCNLHILALIGFTVLSVCDLNVWSTDLTIHGLNGRNTVYIPAKFHRNSLKNNGEHCLQHFLRGCLFMTLTFDLRSRSFHQVVSLSWTIDQQNMRKDREIAEYAFSDIFRHDAISTP